MVTDGDDGLDLDSIARLSRAASELLDDLDSAEYVLEVTSPGVDRPLTTEKHFRRARGRKVEMTLSDGTTLTGRLGGQTRGGGTVAWCCATVPAASSQSVASISMRSSKLLSRWSFSPPNPHELELAGQSGKEAEA